MCIRDSADAGERTKFLDWLWELEFGIYGIPVPTQVFFLDIDPDTAISLMAHRENKFTHESQKDIHEKNARHLKQCYAITQELISRYRWEKISCTKEGILLSVEEIHKEIYHRLLQYL